MTDAEYAYHRERAIGVGDLGLCSRTATGKIKIEGEAPMTENQVMNFLSREEFRYLEKLRSLR